MIAIFGKLSLLLCGALIIVLTQPVLAEAAEIAPGLRFACLSMQYCRKGTAGNQSCSTNSAHRVLLTPGSSKGILNDPNTYITECIQVDEHNDGVYESICTTGSSQLDQELFCGPDPTCHNDNLSRLQNNSSIQYSLGRKSGDGIYYKINGQLVKQPSATKVATDALGNIIPPIIEWQSSSATKAVRRFLIWNKIPVPTPVSPTTAGEPTIAPGAIGGQQQGSLTFPYQNPGDVPPSADCSGVAWDPYGRVFDTKTLEPIPETQIVLKQLNPQSGAYEQSFANSSNPHIDNPDTTTRDGAYSFVVVDGNYQLFPSHPSYTQSSQNLTTLLESSPNLGKIYSDLYLIVNGTPVTILQQGKIQHRDIPMEPANGIGFHYPLNLLDSYEYPTEKELTGTVKKILFGGIVSHPFADLTVQTCTTLPDATESCRNTKTYTQANGGPDKNGVFAITLNQDELLPGEYTKKSFTAADLTTKPLTLRDRIKAFFISVISVKPAIAQESRRSLSVRSQPIVTYLEGYAYTGEGVLIPYAKVMIMGKYSPSPTYTTSADEHGYFQITSDHLPLTQYTIRYMRPSDAQYSSTLTTSQFLEQNAQFIAQEKINPFMSTSDHANPRRFVTPAFVASTTISPLPRVSPPIGPQDGLKNNPVNTLLSKQNKPDIVGPQPNQLMLIGVALIMIGITGAIGAYLVLKKPSHH